MLSQSLSDARRLDRTIEAPGQIRWWYIPIAGIALWAIFGAVPLFIRWMGMIEPTAWASLGTIGDNFGAANALFSGLAFLAVSSTLWIQYRQLYLQRLELQLTRDELARAADAQKDISAHQKNAISLQVILPLMTEIGTEEMRTAIVTIADFRRHYGEDGSFVQFYSYLLERRRKNLLVEGEEEILSKIDQSRRRFVMLFHKIHRLSKGGVVDDDVVRLVVGPDLADIFLEVVWRMEAAIRPNAQQDLTLFVNRLYTEEQRIQDGRY